MTDSAAIEGGVIVKAADAERLAKVTGDNARLRAEVRQAVTRAQRAEAEVARVRSSTKFVIGNLFVQAAKHPRKLLVLPRDLFRLYRLRKHRRATPEEAPAVLSRAHRSELSDEHAARLLLPRIAAQPRAVIALAGAIAPIDQRMWSSCARVTSALPHDGAALILDTDPDIVIIDTSTALPAGSWSHLGNPAATDRSLAALDMANAARERGRPSVLLRTTSRAHTAGLDWLAERCDLVVDGPGSEGPVTWHPGIDIGAWVNAPVHFDHFDSKHPGSEHPRIAVLGDLPFDILTWATARDLNVSALQDSAPPWTALSRFIGGASIVVHMPPSAPGGGVDTALLGALASGARTVTSANSELTAILGESLSEETVVYADSAIALPDAMTDAITDALSRGRLSSVAHWQVLRQLFHTVTSPVTLEDLSRRLGIAADPAAVRGIALVDDPVIAPEAIVDFIQAQRLTPRALITNRELPDRARSILEQLGISILPNLVAAPPTLPPGDMSSAAQLSECALITAIDPTIIASAHPFTLTDAVIGYEISDGEAIYLRSAADPRQATMMIASRQAALDGRPSRALSVDYPGLTP